MLRCGPRLHPEPHHLLRATVAAVPTEDIQTLADRPGWTVDGKVATYAPVEGGWSARVTRVRVAGHTYERWHIAIRDRHGVARHVLHASMLGEAIRLAEQSVRGRNAVG